ncbi:MAG: CHAT domain-containing tetratricopeptide repeat protein [Hyphomicrobiales bacterium]
MKMTWRLLAATALVPAVVLAAVPFVLAQNKKVQPQSSKEMSLEEAKKVASVSKKNYATPPRTIDDIAKILDQNKPDPEKIRKLRATADSQPPANLSGAALADFLFVRGLAARDLGKTQQRVADLREAFKLVKQTVLKRSSIYVVDFPTRSNPEGSPAFQAYINAKRAANMGGGNNGPRGGADLSAMTPQERMRRMSGGPGGPRPGGGSGMSNLDRMPKSPQEALQRFRERVSPEQTRAVRIMQAYVDAEADAGNYKTATTVYEEVRPAVLTTMTGAAMATDSRLVAIRLRIGDVDGAKRALARTQQLAALQRAHPFLSAHWNNQSTGTERASGEIALATGQYAEAELRFRNALRFNEATFKDVALWPEPPVPKGLETTGATIRILLGQSLAKQNKLIEAEVEIRRALIDFLNLQGVDGPKTAHTVLIFADILQAQGRYKDATRLAEVALDIYERGGVEKATHADAIQRIAVGQASQGRWADAMKTYEKLKAVVADDEVARRKYADTNLDLAVALVRGGQAASAITIIENVIKKRVAEGGDNEYQVAEARGFLGSALAAAGRSEDALRTLHGVIPVLLTASDASAKEEGAVDDQNRRQMIIDSYFTALTLARGSEAERALKIDAVDEAFRMADIAHAKSVHSAIAASSARAASGEAALVELIRQAQDNDQQISGVSDLLKATLEAPADQQEAGVLQSLRKDVAQLKEARKTLRREIEKRFPQYAELINPKPVGIAEARAKLHDDEVLLTTYFSGGRGYVWAVRKHGDVAFAQMPLGESEIIKLIDELLVAVTSNVVSISEIPAFNVDKAQKLYAALLEPVAAGLKGAKNIVVVPHGSLGRLPFSLLVTKATPQPQESQGRTLFTGYRAIPFLIRETAVTHLPSVAAFKSLRSVPAGSASRKPFIGFGDPWFSAEQAEKAKSEQAPIAVAMRGGKLKLRAAPATSSMASAELAQLPRLPDTAFEVREIALALGANADTDVILGAKASEQLVRSMQLNDRRVVMFATHGLIPGELDGLNQPALALSSPEIAGVEGDGLLTVEKILGLKLDADWVVLSACNTAAGEGGGAEAVSGLGRAFFYAGARALLVTHWPVETTAARVLTTDLFRRQAADHKLSRAGALREAMVEMIDKGERVDPDSKQAMFTYAHPLFWAPFALVGDGEGSKTN